MKKIFITLVTLISCITLSSIILPQDCEEPNDVWFKISNDERTYGETIAVDMSRGYAGTDGQYIYLFVMDKNTKEEMIIAFPIGYWEVEKKSEFEKELEKEFKDLEDYLRQNKGKGIKIQKQYK
tara:strand:+ start:424 stop:795 length:372 start_codon:yes stop_codon:yes gene_type:complete